MKIFMTGATGFIGARLAQTLAEQGHTVHALVRKTSDVSVIQHKNIKLFVGDISDGPSLEKAIKGCDQVYHLGAYVKVWAKDPAQFFRINVTGTILILQAAEKLKVKKTVITSTADVYGPSGKDLLHEDSIRLTEFMSEYESSKFMSEEKIQHFIRRHKMDVVIVNPTRLYGPGLLNDSNAVTKMIKDYISGKWHIIPGDGLSVGNYVYVEDVVQGHILAMEKGRCGEKYILGGENISYSGFFEVLTEVSGKKHWLIKVPLWLMLMVGRIQLLMAKVFGIAPLIVPRWVRRFMLNWALSSDKAAQELGYKPVSLKEGFKKTIEWLHSEEGKEL